MTPPTELPTASGSCAGRGSSKRRIARFPLTPNSVALRPVPGIVDYPAFIVNGPPLFRGTPQAMG